MNECSRQNIESFFTSIAPWRAAYGSARLHYLGLRRGEQLQLLSARIYLSVGVGSSSKEHFQSGAVEAGQWDIPVDRLSVEQVVQSRVSPTGLAIEGNGLLMLAATDFDDGVSASTPILLHPEGLDAGNRLAVLSVSGAHRHSYLTQPDTDWLLRGARIPFDNINELSAEYGLGAYRGDLSLLEVVAYTAVQVSARSIVKGSKAVIGIWMSKTLDKSKAQIGYRVVDKGAVVLRGAITGDKLAWEEEQGAVVGLAELEVQPGSIVQSFASYDGHAHDVRWHADPSIFQNPRASVLSVVDQSRQILRGYLLPELPARGRVADDFEAAVGWMLWALGFAPASFGTNSQTRDAFDTIAVAPRGDFLVVESTLGLLRAEGKLSKLAARAAVVRELLDASNMRHLRVLPVIVTAMTREQVKADLPQAEETGVVVVTRDNLERAFNELLRFPDADNLFEQAFQSLRPNKFAGVGTA